MFKKKDAKKPEDDKQGANTNPIVLEQKSLNKLQDFQLLETLGTCELL
jgi:hypothetical protein